MNAAPLVTFGLMFHNQRRYARAALAGAFAQTYRPLELIIADDCSTDGTAEEISAFLAGHDAAADFTVRYVHSERNLGDVGNWERLLALAHGVLVVKADGDDVSRPERTARIVAAYLADGAEAMLVCHSGYQIGPRGERYGRLRRVNADWPLGAAMAVSPKLLELFGPVADGHIGDDEIYNRRALMAGRVLEIGDRLIDYRLGTGASTALWDLRRQLAFCLRESRATVEVSLRDAERLMPVAREEWRRRLELRREQVEAKAALVESRSFRERLAAFRRLGGRSAFSVAAYLKLAFLLPRPLGAPMLFAYVLGRNALRRLRVI